METDLVPVHLAPIVWSAAASTRTRHVTDDHIPAARNMVDVRCTIDHLVGANKLVRDYMLIRSVGAEGAVGVMSSRGLGR